MHDLAVEQVSNGGKPDMRVRADIKPVAGTEFRWAEMIEEYERTDHARACRGQRPADGKVAEVDGARHDHLTDRIALIAVARLRILAGKEAHGLILYKRISYVSVVQTADRKSTRLNSSHLGISYAVFC